MRLLPARWSKRAIQPLSFDAWAASYFSYLGTTQGYFPAATTLYGQTKQEMPDGYIGAVQQMYRQNGVVFACMSARALLFAEARFQFRRIRNGRPGELFGTDALSLLEQPWPNGTTADLLARGLQDVDLAGNFYVWKQNAGQLRVMRPDWVSIVLGSNMDAADPALALDAEPIGYIYHPGGVRSGHDTISLGVDEVAHWAPNPDPLARFRGISWLTPVIREVMADAAASDHKLKFFENGATPNLAVKMDPAVKEEAFDRWVARFKEQHEGVENAYRTLFLGGADVTVIGANMRQIDFKTTQGAGETRIAAAAGIPPVIVGLSEGLQSATYSNYELAMRRFTDLTMRPLWRQFAGAMAPIVDVPGGAELWYDDRDIPALAENGRDAAEIQSVQAGTVHTLIAAGFQPDSVLAFIEAGGDFTKLEHSGLFSVQLQPAGSITEGKGALVAGTPVPAENAPPAPASTNGAEAAAPANT